MVNKHLSIILALLLDVDNQDLLDIERPLQQVVELEHAFNLSGRPAVPDTVQIEPEFGVVHDILWLSVFWMQLLKSISAYHAQRP